MGERMIPTWFNYLPTPEKKRMDSYLREWRTFNLNIIRHAREVRVPPHSLSTPPYFHLIILKKFSVNLNAQWSAFLGGLIREVR